MSRRVADMSKEVGRRRSYRALGAIICLWLLLWVGWKSIESHKNKSDLILFSCEGISLDAIRITVKVPKWRSTIVISEVISRQWAMMVWIRVIAIEDVESDSIFAMF